MCEALSREVAAIQTGGSPEYIVQNGFFRESHAGIFVYTLETAGPALVGDGTPATLKLGNRSIECTLATSAQSRDIRLSSPINLGTRFASALVILHQEQIWERLLGLLRGILLGPTTGRFNGALADLAISGTEGLPTTCDDPAVSWHNESGRLSTDAARTPQVSFHVCPYT